MRHKEGIHKFADEQSRGSAIFITCRYCKQSLGGLWDDREYLSGHKPDCDALLAGLTKDGRIEWEKERAALPEHERLFLDMFSQYLSETLAADLHVSDELKGRLKDE